MTHELDDLLLHYGVKGMKWGVRRNRNKPGGADGKDNSKGQNGNKKTSVGKRVKEGWKSMSRERQWRKIINDIENMPTKDIERATTRIQQENALKRLSKTKNVGTPKDKSDYRNREKMSDEELNRKVARLRAKDNLHKQIQEATKEQREFGKRVVQTAAPIAVKYALKQEITADDIFEAYKHPDKARDKVLKSYTDRLENKKPKSKK